MSNIASLDSLKKKEEDVGAGGVAPGQEYYTGGADGRGGGSGMAVVDPSNAGRGGNIGTGDPYAAVFERAQRESESAQNMPPPNDDMVDVTIYANGFTVGDGPLRKPGVPANDSFMRDLNEGICPPELIRDGKPMSAKLTDKRGEEYKAAAYVAFSGGGQSMGGDSASGGVLTKQSGATAPSVNESQPTVRIQLVFPGGKKQVVKLNKTHTVRDLAKMVSSSPNAPAGNYQLLSATRGPPKAIEDLDGSVEPLNGAAVNVKPC